MSIEIVNINEKLAKFNEFWSPVIVGELNEQYVKLAKLKGEFIWHKHEHEDELFFVISGKLKIELREKTIALEPGEFVVIPKGIEHKPIAESEVKIMLFEPKTTLNTGNEKNKLTKDRLSRI